MIVCNDNLYKLFNFFKRYVALKYPEVKPENLNDVTLSIMLNMVFGNIEDITYYKNGDNIDIKNNFSYKLPTDYIAIMEILEDKLNEEEEKKNNGK